jgi:hypothetical protein
MPTTTRLLRHRLLHKFNFSHAEHRSTDHEWYSLQLEGIPAIITKLSHGEAEIGANLEGKIARQLRVRKEFMLEMLACTKSRDEYVRQVHNHPVPPWDVHL